ncbi:helix-turn-helix domain-containing protein [Naumannella cuiyingiana]|uniref:Transcriptional regulator with XRE-family HTH domain n=1 Tax=Naumannella cuiyingiana TaxID=1347891 RepID=A0A7Z0D7D4_9ACTN|nr:transcriptional regulator with XRE-family HTH domain [Naumannella cuiyingiana]
MSEEVDAVTVADLGAVIRTTRKRLGMSVADLATRAGVSFGLVSELERGKGNPSFSSLSRLAAALDMPLAALVSPRADDAMVVRGDQRTHIPVAPGTPASMRVVRELLTPRTALVIQLIRSTLPPGFSNEEQPFRHLGTEAVTVESGVLIVVHGERRVRLAAGDSITYPCSVPHWWANGDDGETVVLGAVSPIEP